MHSVARFKMGWPIFKWDQPILKQDKNSKSGCNINMHMYVCIINIATQISACNAVDHQNKQITNLSGHMA